MACGQFQYVKKELKSKENLEQKISNSRFIANDTHKRISDIKSSSLIAETNVNRILCIGIVANRLFKTMQIACNFNIDIGTF